jgi:hypothetical protein
MQIVLLLCFLSFTFAGTITHNVSCAGGLCGPGINPPSSFTDPTGGSYTIDGFQNPSIECLMGDTHQFVINTPGHPFAIRVARGGASYTPVTGTNPTAAGTISVE